MLLNSLGGGKRRIAEIQFRDLERSTFDAKFLHVAITNRIRGYGVLQRNLQAAGGKQILHCVSCLVPGGARFGKVSIEEWQFSADGVAEFGIREPWNVVKIDRNSR